MSSTRAARRQVTWRMPSFAALCRLLWDALCFGVKWLLKIWRLARYVYKGLKVLAALGSHDAAILVIVVECVLAKAKHLAADFVLSCLEQAAAWLEEHGLNPTPATRTPAVVVKLRRRVDRAMAKSHCGCVLAAAA
jgi:hypothetical protein